METVMLKLNDGCLDFNGILKKMTGLEARVEEYEEKLSNINSIIESMDAEIRYLLEADNNTSDVLINHAEAMKKIETYINDIKDKTSSSKILVNLKVDSVETIE